MSQGTIIKALSGFYYVSDSGEVTQCRARGKFRLDKINPLVGDRVKFKKTDNGKGVIISVNERRNRFIRPAVANIDTLVIIAACVNPVTDPYLIDRIAMVAGLAGSEVVICINKADLNPGRRLREIYSLSGYPVVTTSARTGQGIDELRQVISGKTSAFTGNSGVGKSSILNALDPRFQIKTAEVSDKLGRGRHTTRHVEFFSLGDGTYIADTPGFASFDTELMEPVNKEEIQYTFPEFAPYLGQCRFRNCAHLKEPGCAVTQAAGEGKIPESRYNGYARLYEAYSNIKEWEIK